MAFDKLVDLIDKDDGFLVGIFREVDDSTDFLFKLAEQAAARYNVL